MQSGGTQIQKGVVGSLLLLAAGVAIEEIVDLVCYFWEGKKRQVQLRFGKYIIRRFQLCAEIIQSSPKQKRWCCLLTCVIYEIPKA